MVPIRRLLQRELLGFLVALTSVSALLVWWSMGRVLDAQIAARTTASLDRVAGDLDHDLQAVERVARSVQGLWAAGHLDPREADRALSLLTPLVDPTPAVANLVLVSTEGWGVTIQRLPGGLSAYQLDARRPQGLRRDLQVEGQRIKTAWRPTPYRVFARPWYEEAQQSPGPRWANPYRFINIPQQGFSHVVPLRDGSGALRGALCVDLLMETLSRRVRATEPTPGSQVIMADDRGRALILPEGMTIPRSRENPEASFQPISPRYLPLFHEVLEGWNARGRPGTPYRIRQGGTAWTTSVRPLARLPWRLALAVPDRDFMGPVRALSLVLVTLGVLAALLAAWRLVAFARSLSEPLEELAAGAAAVGEGLTPLPVDTQVLEFHRLDTALQEAHLTLAREAELRLQLGHSQRVETLGALAGGIAHDVNNQLAAIVGQLYLARTKLEEEHPAVKRLDRAEEAAQRCSRTLRALLSFSRKASSEKGPLDLNDLVHRTAQLLEPLLGGHVEVFLDLTPGLPAVLGDSVSLEQVLMNLGVNARDAMPAGGTLRLETTLDEAGEVMLRVADTGTGIPPEVLPRIFEPFFTTKDVGKGTGLGLAMAQSIIEAHGGQIRVESTVGQGTTFHIALPPAADPAAEAGTDPGAAEEVSFAGRRVLVVDDDPHLRELMMDVFLQQRAIVEGVPDGMQAWALVQALTYDLVVTDHRMPFMTGLELVEHIRRSGRPVPIVLVSGFGLEGREAELKLDPRLRVLPKPFSLKTLFSVARELLLH